MSNTALLFILLFFAGLFAAFVKHPIYGVYSYMLTFYMGPGEAWWSENVPDLRWSLVASATTLVAAVLQQSQHSRAPWYKLPSARWLIAFTLWLWIQTPWALSPDDHIFLASLFSKYVLLYAMLYSSLSHPQNIRQFFFTHIIGCFYWGYMAYQNPGSGRLENLGFGDVAGSAFASMHLGTGLAFAAFAFLGTSGIRRWLAFSSIPFVLNAIILMATRGAFLGLLVGAPAAIFFSPKPKRVFVIVCVVLGAVLLLNLANELFWSRMSTIPLETTGTMEASAESRLGIARANLQMFRDHPWGVGHRGNDLLSPLYMPSSLLTQKDGSMIRSAHNTVLAILVDHGFVGLILAVLMHASIGRSLIRLTAVPSPRVWLGLTTYVAALGTALVIYWGNAQFANMTKAEVVIWIAALTGAIESMTVAPQQAGGSGSDKAKKRTKCKTSSIYDNLP